MQQHSSHILKCFVQRCMQQCKKWKGNAFPRSLHHDLQSHQDCREPSAAMNCKLKVNNSESLFPTSDRNASHCICSGKQENLLQSGVWMTVSDIPWPEKMESDSDSGKMDLHMCTLWPAEGFSPMFCVLSEFVSVFMLICLWSSWTSALRHFLVDLLWWSCLCSIVDFDQLVFGVQQGCTSLSEDTIYSGPSAAVERTEPNQWVNCPFVRVTQWDSTRCQCELEQRSYKGNLKKEAEGKGEVSGCD